MKKYTMDELKIATVSQDKYYVLPDQLFKAAGFSTIGICGYQRYDYMNHVKWGRDLTGWEPAQYIKHLHNDKLTDTLIAIATK